MKRTVLFSGFGPFSGCPDNLSKRLAAIAAARVPPGLAGRSVELPVDSDAPEVLRQSAEAVGAIAVVALGVHPGDDVRLELPMVGDENLAIAALGMLRATASYYDAGSSECEAVRASLPSLHVPAAFVHVPQHTRVSPTPIVALACCLAAAGEL